LIGEKRRGGFGCSRSTEPKLQPSKLDEKRGYPWGGQNLGREDPVTFFEGRGIAIKRDAGEGNEDVRFKLLVKPD